MTACTSKFCAIAIRIVGPVPIVLAGHGEIFPHPIIVKEVEPVHKGHVAVLADIGDGVAEAVDKVLDKVNHPDMGVGQVGLEGICTAIG